MMAANPRAEKPTPEMSDKALGQHIAQGRKKLAELAAVELSGQELRAGKGEEALAEMRAIRDTVDAAEAERSRRQARPDTETLGLRLRARRAMEERRRKPHPAKDVIGKVARFAHPELVGWTPDIYRLTPKEGEELVALVQQKWAVSDDRAEAEPLTAKQQARYEKLVGKVAGNEALFAEKRKQAAHAAEREESAEKLRLDGLPRRPVYAEVGSVALPRFVHTWLKNSRGQFTIADVGMLSAMLFMFENQEPLFIGGRFETIDGEPMLILREEQLRFPGSRNNDSMTTGHSGFVRERVALRTLVRNKWFEVEQPADELRIRLGERAKKVRQRS